MELRVFLSKPAGVSQQIQSSPGELWNEAWLEDENCMKRKKRDAEKDDQKNLASPTGFLNVHLTVETGERAFSLFPAVLFISPHSFLLLS